MPTTIRKAIEIKATIDQVWRYMGSEAGLRQWWGSDIRLEAKQGGRCEERSLFNGKPHYLAGEVTVYDPPHQLVLLLRQQEQVETWPAFMTIALTLKEANQHTVVTLEHRALGSLPVEYTTGWTVPQIQPPEPERQVILNQLLTTSSSVAKPALNQPMYMFELTWSRAGEAYWNSCLDKLQQVANET